MTPLVAGLERLTERLGRQSDLTARLMQALPRGAASIGEAAVASTCVHLLVAGRPGVVQVLEDADAGRVFYGRSHPGQILHIDIFHAEGEVDHRLVARQLGRAARVFARDAGSYRVAGLPVEQIPDYIDLQTGTGGGRASGSLIYGRRLSLRLAHRNHVHLAIGLPRALWGFAVYAVAAVEEAVLQTGLELRRVDAVELVCGRGGAPLDLSDYETASDSFLREERRPRPGAGSGPWGGAWGEPRGGSPPLGAQGAPGAPGWGGAAAGGGEGEAGGPGGRGGATGGSPGGGGPGGWAPPGEEVILRGPAPWPGRAGTGDPSEPGDGGASRHRAPGLRGAGSWREVPVGGPDGGWGSSGRLRDGRSGRGREGPGSWRVLWRAWRRGPAEEGRAGTGSAAGPARGRPGHPASTGGLPEGFLPAVGEPGPGTGPEGYPGPWGSQAPLVRGVPGRHRIPGEGGASASPEGSPRRGAAHPQAGDGPRPQEGTGTGAGPAHGEGAASGPGSAEPGAGAAAGSSGGAAVSGAGGPKPGASASPGGLARRQRLLARSLNWLRETGVDLGAALLERLGPGATMRDLQLPGASYEDLRRWLNDLREAGLVERDGERYRLNPQGWELMAYLLEEPGTVRTTLRRLLRVRPARPDPRPGHSPVTVYDDERGRQANRRVVRPWEPGAGGDGLAVAESVMAALARGGLPLRVQPQDLRLYRRLRRHPVDVCLVLDASASMAGNRIRAAKDLAQQLLVSTRDRVAVITFQERVVQVQVPLTRNTSRVERGLSQIQPYGLTPLAQGLEVALLYLAQSRARNPLLVLVTDGIPTVPYRTANPLEDAVQVARQLGTGRFGRVGFTCIGLQPNERYLRELVRAAGGRLYVVDELERETLISIVHRERAQRKERARP
ncbi:VWA domain-containing protein [Thermaerobacter subterraneus]|uniref:Mg-chelatase subunit ChlD n=1 Tax=Thermaerobacter subterraneus DSM 13965 TaxID=867903 RepID=K6PYX9_9FIRM|nr:VWA domain-containing protein [Thermaerobacter subterraneus]EKP93759.1 Mg-chelatase subunit ChlD [Thermaerobacter subterraneus DSM 13965]